MTFLNSAILLGLGALAIPVVLHFLLRQKPRRLVFPALRLLEQRQRQSVRRLQLRHLWLLLLRILALALLVLALARPSLPPANYSLTRGEWGILLGLAALGIGAYAYSLRRLRQRQLTAFQYAQQRSRLRGGWTLGTVAAILLLVGWPYQRRVAAEMTDPPSASELNLPVAAVLLFDTSLSMSYQQAGKNHLDQAREIAVTHLQSMPSGSRVAIADSAVDHPILFQSTMHSAQSRIAALEPRPVSLPLEDRIRDALRAQEDDRRRTMEDLGSSDGRDTPDRYIRRIYLFTDLAKSAWRPAGSALLRSELEKQKFVNLYVVDVGRDEVQHQAILDVRPNSERIPIGGDLAITATAISQGEDLPEQTIGLFFENADGQLTRQGQSVISLSGDLPAQTEFPMVTGLTNRWLQGEARLLGTDPLVFDNARYFTVEVTDPPSILVLAPDRQTATAWMNALAPLDGPYASRNRFQPHFEPVSSLGELTLDRFAAVTLLNVPRLSDDQWFQLSRYVETGGGLIVVLGNTQVHAPSYNRAPAQQFLPGWLDSWQPENSWRFSIDARHHGLFSTFRRLENYGSFSLMENVVDVWRFWKVRPAEGAAVLATFTDPLRSPALLERHYGRGRTILLTTAGDRPANYKEEWNNLPSPLIDSWLFIAFVEQLTNYAAGTRETPKAFLTGQTVTIRLEPAATDRGFLLREPNLKQSRRTLAAGESLLVIPDAIQPGQYSLLTPERREPLAAFSVNVPAGESDLSRLTQQELSDLLGEERFQMARNLEELKDSINASDLGQEIFPVLLALVVVIFCGELVVANRFYDAAEA